MEAEVYNWIRNIVIYMILNTIIMNLLGNKSYKKYVSIVSGMILVLIVISPLIKVMKLEDKLDYFLQYNNFSIETSDFENQIKQVEEDQEDVVFAEYEKKIKTQVKELLTNDKVYVKTCNITIDKKTDSSTFGEIVGMDITASVEETEEVSGNSIQIEGIDISQISIGEMDKEEQQKTLSPLEISIKNELSDFYNMEQGNINISIQGG